MNVEMMKRVRDFIHEHPEHFNLHTYVSRPGGLRTIDPINLNACGTTACIAGTAVLLAAGDRTVTNESTSWATEGATVLGLTMDEAGRLFYAEENSVWHDAAWEFGWEHDEYEIERWQDITAEQAVIVLDRIIAGEVTL